MNGGDEYDDYNDDDGGRGSGVTDNSENENVSDDAA